MTSRRKLIMSSLLAAVSLVRLRLPAAGAAAMPRFRLVREVPCRFFDGEHFWVHARAGIVPGAGKHGLPRVVMTMNSMQTTGSDVFKAMLGLTTDDLGASWSAPRGLAALAPRIESIDGVERPVAVSDFWPRWHAPGQILLGTGHTVAYTPEWKVERPRPRSTSYSIYDPAADAWSPWQKLAMPPGAKFHDAGAGCAQRCDLPDGTILLPFYFRPAGLNSRVAVARCALADGTLQYLEHGDELSLDDGTRGLHEPSLVRWGGEYFLTIRHDQRAFVARGRDGLRFEPFQPWRFDDGAELGSYNTQQHWVGHHDALYLVYTRRGADNDHVFRHRAPLFMARVDPTRLCVVRASEIVLVPQRGARLGNFGVVDVSRDETWVTVSEWMQPRGVEQYGSDGSVFVARLHWSRPNADFEAGVDGQPRPAAQREAG